MIGAVGGGTTSERIVRQAQILQLNVWAEALDDDIEERNIWDNVIWDGDVHDNDILHLEDIIWELGHIQMCISIFSKIHDIRVYWDPVWSSKHFHSPTTVTFFSLLRV